METGTLKRALLIPRGVLEFASPDNISVDATVVVYCKNGFRAALAGAALKQLGYSDVFNGGGIDELEAAGASVVPFGPQAPPPAA